MCIGKIILKYLRYKSYLNILMSDAFPFLIMYFLYILQHKIFVNVKVLLIEYILVKIIFFYIFKVKVEKESILYSIHTDIIN